MIIPNSSALWLALIVVFVAFLGARLLLLISARQTGIAPVPQAIGAAGLLLGYGILLSSACPHYFMVQTTWLSLPDHASIILPTAIYVPLALPLFILVALRFLLHASSKWLLPPTQRLALGENALAVSEAAALVSLCLVCAGLLAQILEIMTPTLVGGGIR